MLLSQAGIEGGRDRGVLHIQALTEHSEALGEKQGLPLLQTEGEMREKGNGGGCEGTADVGEGLKCWSFGDLQVSSPARLLCRTNMRLHAGRERGTQPGRCPLRELVSACDPPKKIQWVRQPALIRMHCTPQLGAGSSACHTHPAPQLLSLGEGVGRRETGAPLPGGFAGRDSSHCQLAQPAALAAELGSSWHSPGRSAGWRRQQGQRRVEKHEPWL